MASVFLMAAAGYGNGCWPRFVIRDNVCEASVRPNLAGGNVRGRLRPATKKGIWLARPCSGAIKTEIYHRSAEPCLILRDDRA